MDIQQQILNKIKGIIKDEEISQKKFAENCNIPYTTVNGWFTKKQRPTIDCLDKISKYYNITIDYLIGNENENGFIEIDNKLSKEEEHILKMIQKLDTKQKAKAEGYIAAMIDENKYKTIKEG